MIYSAIKSFSSCIALRRQIARERMSTLSYASELVISGERNFLGIEADKTLCQDRWLTLGHNGVRELWCDLVEGIPFLDDSVDEIHSSHVFEHVLPDSLVVLLRYRLRALAPGGSVSVCVTNLLLLLDPCCKNLLFVDQENERCCEKGWFEIGSLIDRINYIAYTVSEHRLILDNNKSSGFDLPCRLSSCSHA